ncbi:MAG: hypothetical protein GY827_06380 [Cytophagales bacterium]|nr:hypothetical protein [Cytophagales bacterium]
MRKLFFILGIVIGFVPNISWATALKPQGKFIQKNIKIAQEVQFCLSIRHPKNIELVFPDSSFDFSPLEFVSKEYFTTKSDSSTSIDSAVYTLTTYEIDELQTLRMPIYILNGKDSVVTWSDTDTLFFLTTVGKMPNPIVLQQNTSLQRIEYDFNYYYFFTGLIILLIVVGVSLFLFKNNLRVLYYSWKLDYQYNRFLKQFEAKKEFQNTQELQELVWIWKKFLGKLEQQPIETYTTKDLMEFYYDNKLNEALQKIDYCLYAEPTNIDANELLNFGKHIVEQKKQALTNGK